MDRWSCSLTVNCHVFCFWNVFGRFSDIANFPLVFHVPINNFQYKQVTLLPKPNFQFINKFVNVPEKENEVAVIRRSAYHAKEFSTSRRNCGLYFFILEQKSLSKKSISISSFFSAKFRNIVIKRWWILPIFPRYSSSKN